MPEVKILLEGYKKFHQQHFVENTELFKQLSEKQTPKTMIITCCDSRLSPSLMTNTEAGELFVIRNVANLVPPYQPVPDSLHGVSAALEFGTCHLKVKHIVVMGHSGCGGIKALRQGITKPDDGGFSFIEPWMKLAKSARNCSTDMQCEQESIRISLKNLMTFPWIQSRVEQSELKLHGWYFNIKDGNLSILQDGNFIPLDPETA